jgi:hypothetical protein
MKSYYNGGIKWIPNEKSVDIVYALEHYDLKTATKTELLYLKQEITKLIKHYEKNEKPNWYVTWMRRYYNKIVNLI